jgi:hypothetical protein
MPRLALATTVDARHIFISLPMAACCRLASVAVFNTIDVAICRPLLAEGTTPETRISPALAGSGTGLVAAFMVPVYSNSPHYG